MPDGAFNGIKKKGPFKGSFFLRFREMGCANPGDGMPFARRRNEVFVLFFGGGACLLCERRFGISVP